ncbi:MAG: YIP1 family protein [Anaerolineae bacterium]
MVTNILRRIGLIFKRDIAVFTEIRFDRKANLEAAAIILVVSLISALASALFSENFTGTLVIRLITGVILNWLLWSYVIVFVLTNLYGVDAEFWQVARLIGYANLPMIFSLLNVFTCLRVLVTSLTWILTLVLAFFMVRESYETTTERTLVAIGIGWIAIILIDLALRLVFHIG